MELLKYINDVNILLVVLDILFLIISFLFLNKRDVSPRGKDIFVIIYTLINLFLFSYVNSMFQSIFTLKYLSVRTYLIVVLISLFIFLYTFNKKVKLFYRLVNYLMVILISIILLVNIYVIASERLKIYNIMDISNSITLMNITFIIFSVYLVIISLGYIGFYLYDLYLIKKKNEVKEVVLDNNINKKSKIKLAKDKFKNNIKKSDIKKRDIEEITKKKDAQKESIKDDDLNKKELIDKSKNIDEKMSGVFEKNDSSNIINEKSNSIDSLLNYKVGDNFYINGVDCSIIFCDSNKENIVKNYDILSRDINAKLVNGYTLKENIMIKDICNKLNVGNLGNVDVNNLSLLNFINVDEYMFLKKIFSEN